MRPMSIAVAALLLAPPTSAVAKGAVLRVCSEAPGSLGIGPDPFADGPLTVPNRTMFRFVGVPFRFDLHPRRDERSHMPDLRRGHPALVTERALHLTATHPCAESPVAALLSPRFGWHEARISGTGGARFAPHGLVRSGRYDPSYGGASTAFKRATVQGRIRATLRGTTDHAVRLAKRNLHVVPHR